MRGGSLKFFMRVGTFCEHLFCWPITSWFWVGFFLGGRWNAIVYHFYSNVPYIWYFITYATVADFHTLIFISVADINQICYFMVFVDRDFVYSFFLTKMSHSIGYVSYKMLTKYLCLNRKSIPVQLNGASASPAKLNVTVREEDAFIR